MNGKEKKECSLLFVHTNILRSLNLVLVLGLLSNFACKHKIENRTNAQSSESLSSSTPVEAAKLESAHKVFVINSQEALGLSGKVFILNILNKEGSEIGEVGVKAASDLPPTKLPSVLKSNQKTISGNTLNFSSKGQELSYTHLDANFNDLDLIPVSSVDELKLDPDGSFVLLNKEEGLLQNIQKSEKQFLHRGVEYSLLKEENGLALLFAKSLQDPRIRKIYDANEAEKISGKFIESRPLYEDIDLHIHEKESILTWKQGPLKGHVFRIFKKKENAEFHPFKVEEINKLIDDAIDEYAILNKQTYHPMDRSNTKYDEYATHASNPEQIQVKEKLARNFFEIFEEKKYGDYYFKEAQYFHFEGEAREALDLYSHINRVGVQNYIEARAIQRLAGPEIDVKIKEMEGQNPSKEKEEIYSKFKNCVKNIESILLLGRDFWIDECKLKTKALSNEERIEFNKFYWQIRNKWYLSPFYDVRIIGKTKFVSPELSSKLPEDIYLVHGTTSTKLPNIIQAGGLAGVNYNKGKMGIVKSSGGEIGGSSGMDPGLVSFYTLDKEASLAIGYAPKRGFEYPVSFGVSDKVKNKPHCFNASSPKYGKMSDGELQKLIKENPNLLNVSNKRDPNFINTGVYSAHTTIQAERTVSHYFPMDCIDFLFVPFFAVDEVKQILKGQGLGMEVLPYPHNAGQ